MIKFQVFTSFTRHCLSGSHAKLRFLAIFLLEMITFMRKLGFFRFHQNFRWIGNESDWIFINISNLKDFQKSGLKIELVLRLCYFRKNEICKFLAFWKNGGVPFSSGGWKWTYPRSLVPSMITSVTSLITEPMGQPLSRGPEFILLNHVFLIFSNF